ncbi:DUF427 domain-containing protein [Mycobacterium sp. THU-M104]|uniref:DUF427 domain-containing protein n=1 Tax=Mycobacterium sp. THU-M104 TaxID=3410515 RepID=UPI003B9A3EFB
MSRRQPERDAPQPENVWDYPRPPRVEPFTGAITVELGGAVVASTSQALRVLETSHPPTYYLPREAFAPGALRAAPGSSWCEWKGQAAYYDVAGGSAVAPKAAWAYPRPTPAFASIAGMVAVMAARVDRCTVNGEVVEPQPGDFYGGWITSWITGPFKGVPGSRGW